MEKERFAEAITQYQKLVLRDETDLRSLQKIGDLQRQLGRHAEAADTFERVAENYCRDGFLLKAVAVYKQIRAAIDQHAPALDDRHNRVLVRLAELYSELDLTSDALVAFDQAAMRLRSQGRETDAFQLLKKILDRDPRNPLALLRVADSRLRLGHTDEALRLFGEAAKTLLELGRRDEVIKVVDHVLELQFVQDLALMAADLHLERNAEDDVVNALDKLQRCYSADPKHLPTLRALARAFDAIGKADAAISVLKEAAHAARDADATRELVELTDILAERVPDDSVLERLSPALDKARDELRILAEITDVTAILAHKQHTPVPQPAAHLA
ncbi:tetratricopeptide repeat protein, partial [Desulfobulbus sp. AH-315-M07]|nr:tetratricopeptide repeat protein [Desulfobulbus sp. AH-315-M07]